MEGRASQRGSEVVSQRAYDAAPSWLDFARKPIGTGPYKVREYKPDDMLILDAHDDYWGGRPPIKTLRLVEVPEIASRVNGLLTGEFQFACDIPPDQVGRIERNPASTRCWAAPSRTSASSRLTCTTRSCATRACVWRWRTRSTGRRSSTACGRAARASPPACSSSSTRTCSSRAGPSRNTTRRRPGSC